jgi:hypothetical protein
MPCYFAWLHWPRLASSTLRPWFFAGLGRQHIEKSSVDGFTFRVWLDLGDDSESGQELVSFAHDQQLFVSWLGIQAKDETHGELSAKGQA